MFNNRLRIYSERACTLELNSRAEAAGAFQTGRINCSGIACMVPSTARMHNASDEGAINSSTERWMMN
jgi:hypothetical protein